MIVGFLIGEIMSYYAVCTCGCGANEFLSESKEEAIKMLNGMLEDYNNGLVDDILEDGGSGCKEAFGLELKEF
jgi:hypothetical protein